MKKKKSVLNGIYLPVCFFAFIMSLLYTRYQVRIMYYAGFRFCMRIIAAVHVHVFYSKFEG